MCGVCLCMPAWCNKHTHPIFCPFQFIYFIDWWGIYLADGKLIQQHAHPHTKTHIPFVMGRQLRINYSVMTISTLQISMTITLECTRMNLRKNPYSKFAVELIWFHYHGDHYFVIWEALCGRTSMNKKCVMYFSMNSFLTYIFSHEYANISFDNVIYFPPECTCIFILWVIRKLLSRWSIVVRFFTNDTSIVNILSIER